MEGSNWIVAFACVKAHAGILGNELADQLAKTAARVKDKTTSYSRKLLSTLFRELEEESKLKWQQNWEESPKAAQTKQFYPSITDRLKLKIHITTNFTAMVSGHGKTRNYLHRFKLLESATCPCKQGRSDYGPLALPLHPKSKSKGNTQEGYTKTWNLANKQILSNNQTTELI